MSIYKGGYLTIDCGGQDILTEGGVEIAGSYNAVKETFGKVVILENVTIGNSTFKYFVLDNLVEGASDYAREGIDIIIYIYSANDHIEAVAAE